MTAKKGFAQPLIILILLAVLAVVTLNFKTISNWATRFNPPPTPYVNTIPQWKVYKNSTYKFSVEYPNTWFVRTYGDYAANFQTTDPKLGEATPGAIRVKFSALTENADKNEFERISKSNTDIYEPLDVKSIITKVKNFEVNGNRAVEYVVNRSFSALEGPRGEFTHVFSVNTKPAVLKFFTSADNKVDEQKFDAIFERIITTLKF